MSNLYLVKGEIAQLPEKMLEGAWEEIIQAVTLMKALAQVYVRVDTGSLRDSIRVERGGEDMKITVTYIKSEYPLGTTDGQWYTVMPAGPDNDEEGQHGRS